jgi:hypothetical protein
MHTWNAGGSVTVSKPSFTPAVQVSLRRDKIARAREVVGRAGRGCRSGTSAATTLYRLRDRIVCVRRRTDKSSRHHRVERIGFLRHIDAV